MGQQRHRAADVVYLPNTAAERARSPLYEREIAAEVMHRLRNDAWQGDADSAVTLGSMHHWFGDDEQATHWWSVAANRRNRPGMAAYGLALCRAGNCADGAIWIDQSLIGRPAAEPDRSEFVGIGNLMLAIAENWGAFRERARAALPPDPVVDEAVHMLVHRDGNRARESAAAGNGTAAQVLGMSLSALGDVRAAQDWYGVAASTGGVDGMTLLGFTLGYRGDVALAAQWFGRALATVVDGPVQRPEGAGDPTLVLAAQAHAWAMSDRMPAGSSGPTADELIDRVEASFNAEFPEIVTVLRRWRTDRAADVNAD